MIARQNVETAREGRDTRARLERAPVRRARAWVRGRARAWAQVRAGAGERAPVMGAWARAQ